MTRGWLFDSRRYSSTSFSAEDAIQYSSADCRDSSSALYKRQAGWNGTAQRQKMRDLPFSLSKSTTLFTPRRTHSPNAGCITAFLSVMLMKGVCVGWLPPSCSSSFQHGKRCSSEQRCALHPALLSHAAGTSPADGLLPKLRQLEHDERGRCKGSPQSRYCRSQTGGSRPPGRGDHPDRKNAFLKSA